MVNSPLIPKTIRFKKTLSNGIVRDLQLAFANELQLNTKLIYISRKRITEASTKGSLNVDLICMISPEWLGSDAQLFDWLPPIMPITERIIGIPGTAKIKSVEQLYGKNIGTVLGYHYTPLETGFNSGKITRDDAPQEINAIRKLMAHRVNYTIMRELDFYYWQKTIPSFRQFEISTLLISSSDFRCARSKYSAITRAQLIKAQEAILANGQLTAILAKYGSVN